MATDHHLEDTPLDQIKSSQIYLRHIVQHKQANNSEQEKSVPTGHKESCTNMRPVKTGKQ